MDKAAGLAAGAGEVKIGMEPLPQVRLFEGDDPIWVSFLGRPHDLGF